MEELRPSAEEKRISRSVEDVLASMCATAFLELCDALDSAEMEGSPHAIARRIGKAYVDFALVNPHRYRLMFDNGFTRKSSHGELNKARQRAERRKISYIEPLIEQGVLRGNAHLLGQLMWSATHGLVMLRFSGILSTDEELRQLHESTMSALVRGISKVSAPTNRLK